MRPVSLAAAVAAVLGSTTVLAAPPTTPADLRVDVYSGTAAELFWSRSSDPDGAVSGYEIRRDGELVETRDGLSYFTDSLTEGRAFAFTVTAVDFDGERSAPASVSVVGGDRDGAVGAGGGRPPPPANLSSSVYSSSAAEVFWDRSDQPGLSYEVSVDGGPVTTTDGTSAFLTGLDGARGRGVDVVAIDPNGQRSGAANVTLGGGSGGGVPNPPTGGGASDVPAPSSLRAELYSGSAGEVFWDRVPGASLSYEVRLDGETVATTTGTSYFVDDRPGLDGTSVEVVAIGPGGTRSSASSTTLGSGGGSANPDPDPAPGTEAPPAPANARLEVYSGTAAELFWDRAPASANVVETEIVRDGEVIGTTDGKSFFDPNRVPGVDYRYELIAVDRDGRRSSASTASGNIETPPTEADTATFLGRPWRESAVLAAQVLTGSSLETIDDAVSEALDTLDVPDPPLPGNAPVTGNRPCPGGGSFSWSRAQEFGTIGRGTRVEDDYVFTDCAVDGRTLDGTYSTTGESGSVQSSISSRSSRTYALSSVGPDGESFAARGMVSSRESSNASFRCPGAETGSAFEATFESIRVADASLGVVLDEYSADRESRTNLILFTPPRTCLQELATTFDDRARYSVDGTAFEVSRTGTGRVRDEDAAAAGDPADAVLELRTVGDAVSSLRVEAGATNEVALVTIDDDGSTVSFEAPWRFGREGE